MTGKYIKIQDVEVMRSSGKATLVEIAGEEFWIPNSQIHEDSEAVDRGDVGELIITKWIAEMKGII